MRRSRSRSSGCAALAEGRRLFYLYVVDERGHLLGLGSLWQLVSAGADRKLRDILSADVVTVRVDMPEGEIARVFSKYDLLTMPVVDEDGRLAGAITVDDVLDVVQERATEDLYRLANLDLHEDLATPPVRSVRLRLPWLLINLATAFLAAGVVSLFQETIAKYVVLAVFMPIVAGMGGNAGTQTLTVLVRGIALGEMDLRDAASVVGRQTLVGLMNGVLTGLMLGLCALAWERNPTLAGVLLFAETVNLTVAGFFGAAVPLVLKRMRPRPRPRQLDLRHHRHRRLRLLRLPRHRHRPALVASALAIRSSCSRLSGGLERSNRPATGEAQRD